MNLKASFFLTVSSVVLLGCSTPSIQGGSQSNNNTIYVELRSASRVPSAKGSIDFDLEKNPNSDTVYLVFNNPTTSTVSLNSVVLSGGDGNHCTVKSQQPLQVPAQTYSKIEVVDFSTLEQCVLGSERSKTDPFTVAITGNPRYSSGPNTRNFSTAFMVSVGYSYGQVQSITNLAAFTYYISYI